MTPHSDTCSQLPLEARRHRVVHELDAALNRLKIDLGQAVIACSGGADSTALLLAASVIVGRRKRSQAIEPLVVYVHHHLRPEADQEAEAVEVLATQLGMPFCCVNIAPGEAAGSLAAAARDLRYQALADEAIGIDASFVLTAHHADDQFETMLMSLARGAGASGICGMPQRRPLVQTKGGTIELIRPLLHLDHKSLCEFCQVAEISWFEDASNVDPTSPRIRVRREVTPVFESIWPGAVRRASMTSEILEEAAGALEEKVATLFGSPQMTRWDRKKLANQPRVLIAMGLHRAALYLGAAADSISQRHLIPSSDAITDHQKRPRTFTWEGGLELHVTAHEVWLSYAE